MGGFTVDAAEIICRTENDKEGDDATSQSQAFDVFEGLTSLVDKSLLVSAEHSGNETRFRMLQVVREYGLELFEASDEEGVVRQRHAEYFLAVAKEAEPELLTGTSLQWLSRLEGEHDNLRAALRWFLDHDPQKAAVFVVALRYFWSRQNHMMEARKWFERILNVKELDVPSAVRFKLLNGSGIFAKQQGDYETARKMYEIGLAEAKKANDGPQIAAASRGLGMIALKQMDLVTGRRFLEEGLVISRGLNDKLELAISLSMLGILNGWRVILTKPVLYLPIACLSRGSWTKNGSRP